MMVQLIFFLCLVSGLFCVGGFLWSAMEQKPKAFWLLGGTAILIVGLAGLLLHKG